MIMISRRHGAARGRLLRIQIRFEFGPCRHGRDRRLDRSRGELNPPNNVLCLIYSPPTNVRVGMDPESVTRCRVQCGVMMWSRRRPLARCEWEAARRSRSACGAYVRALPSVVVWPVPPSSGFARSSLVASPRARWARAGSTSLTTATIRTRMPSEK